MKKQLGFMIDQAKCIGCGTCQMACKDYKQLDVGMNFRRIYEYEGGDWVQEKPGIYTQNVYAYYSSISCNHCDDAPCITICPTGAMQKRKKDGVVVIDSKRCIGCKSCVMVCPYDAPQYNAKTHKTEKCNMCVERLDEGKNPICVDSCPNRALFQGDIQELREKHGTIAATAPLPSSNLTKPNLVIKTAKDSKGVNDTNGKMVVPAFKYKFPNNI